MHATQSPVHDVLQQTPSTQEPDWHCAPLMHVAPFTSGDTQAPATQTNAAAQSLLPTHAPRHAPPEHA